MIRFKLHMIITTGTTCGAGSIHSSNALEVLQCFVSNRLVQYLDLLVVYTVVCLCFYIHLQINKAKQYLTGKYKKIINLIHVLQGDIMLFILQTLA